MSRKGFVNLGRGLSLNETLVKDVYVRNGNYFVLDTYGVYYKVDKRHYDEVRKVVSK